MENRIVKNGNENELIALELLHEHGNAVVEAPVLVITPKKPPRIITKKQTSSAPPGEGVGVRSTFNNISRSTSEAINRRCQNV